MTELTRLMKRFELSISVSEKDILNILFDSIEKIKQHASVLEINPAKSRFIKNILTFAEAGKNSDLLKDIENTAPVGTSQDQADQGILNSNILAGKSNGFHDRLMPLWNKLTGRR